LTNLANPDYRGVLIEGPGPNWLWGTSFEHSTLYDYQIMNAQNTYMGHIQHETAYYQGNPPSTRPFTPQASWSDPPFDDCTSFNCPRTWALRVVNSSQIFNYGAGHYNFFNNWDGVTCLAAENCNLAMVDFINSTEVYIWAMSTKGSAYMVSWEGTPLVPEEVNKASYTESILLFEMVKTQ
jgi:glucan 1,3-beta-glucosidase